MYVENWVDCSDQPTGPLSAFTWRGERDPDAMPYGTLVIIRSDGVRKQMDAHHEWYLHLRWAVELEPKAAPAMVSAVSGNWRSGRRARRFERKVDEAASAVFDDCSDWAAEASSRLLFAVQWPHPKLFKDNPPSVVAAGSIASVAAVTERDAPDSPLSIGAESVNTTPSDAHIVEQRIMDAFSKPTLRRIVDFD